MNLMACWLQIDFDLLQLSKLKNNGSNDCGSLNNNNSDVSHSLQSRYKIIALLETLVLFSLLLMCLFLVLLILDLCMK